MKIRSMMCPAIGSLILATPIATALKLSPATTHTSCTRLFGATSSAGSGGVSSLPRLVDSTGADVSAETLTDKLTGMRVAYYFSAGWCPMCTSFEKSFVSFLQASEDSGKKIEIIYVPSDRSAEDSGKRAAGLNMLMVPFGEEADKLKLDFKIWAGSEALKFGFGRRSGVPALVVLDKDGNELEFLAAESEGVRALKIWPLNDENGVW